MNYQDFEGKWLGQRTNIDGAEGFQCVDLPKQFWKDAYGIQPVSVKRARRYWEAIPPVLLEKLNALATTDVRAGDVVPLRPVDAQPSHADGHVGLATGQQTETTIEILEQNGANGNGDGEGNNRVRKRWIPKWRVYGVLRRKPQPAPVPGGHPFAWAVGKNVFLKPHISSWRVYAPGSTPPRNPVATLNPKKFGGLTYQILRADTAHNSVVVRTQMFGEVSLPIDKDAEIR